MEDGSQTAGEVLLERPWLPVCIGDRQLLAKAWFGDTAYHILLTDMQCVWEEKMDASAIQSRAQELNKRLRAPVKAFYAHLREVASPCLSGGGETGGEVEGGAQVSLGRPPLDGRGLSVRLKSELAGLPFHWEFHCTPPPVDMVCTQLLRPLLAMTRLLQAQADQLGALLARKDAEILDYKENGATLSRARLQTEVFDEQTHREDLLAQVLPQVSSDQRQEGLGFGADLRELYATVVAHGNAGKRKRAPSGDRDSDDSRGAGEGREAGLAPGHAPAPGGEAARREATPCGEEERGAGREGSATRSKRFEQQPPAGRTQAAAKPKKKKATGLFR